MLNERVTYFCHVACEVYMKHSDHASVRLCVRCRQGKLHVKKLLGDYEPRFWRLSGICVLTTVHQIEGMFTEPVPFTSHSPILVIMYSFIIHGRSYMKVTRIEIICHRRGK